MPLNLETQISEPRTRLEKEIVSLGPWFHNLHLPDGTETAPAHALGDFPSRKWHQLAGSLPEDLKGWRVLDIGCNAGFYTFELARRGARVMGIDVEPRYLHQARWAASLYGLGDQVHFEQAQVYDLARWPQRYDLVLFLGVFYHLRYPLLGLDIVAERTGNLMAFQSLTMPGNEVLPDGAASEFESGSIEDRGALLDPGWPKMAFIEHRFAGDPTNWWVPNQAAVEAMLRSAGFRIVARPGHEMYLCALDPGPMAAAQQFIAAQRDRATGRYQSP
jgi:tRNA (mo5U34)-methyltransferase